MNKACAEEGVQTELSGRDVDALLAGEKLNDSESEDIVIEQKPTDPAKNPNHYYH